MGEHLPLKRMWLNCSPKQLRPAQVPTRQTRALVPHAWRHLVLADFAFSPTCEQKILLISLLFKAVFFPIDLLNIKLPLDILFL